MKIFCVIIEDRHTDTDVQVFSEAQAALDYARSWAKESATHDEDYEEQQITEGMAEDGWIFFAEYSCESDSVRVVVRGLDGEEE